MPKASVHEDDFPMLGENEIRLSRKVGNMEPESVSARTGYFPHQEFRFCIFTVDERHSLAALGPRKGIHFSLAVLIFANGTPRANHAQRSMTRILWKNYTLAGSECKLNYSLFHRLGREACKQRMSAVMRMAEKGDYSVLAAQRR
jgi:hypothetical protein